MLKCVEILLWILTFIIPVSVYLFLWFGFALCCIVKNASLESKTIKHAKFCSNQNSVQFSGSVVPNSLQPHELQHARPACPSPTPGVHPNPHPSSPWCHPAISSSVVPFSSCPQSLPASESFPMSQLFAWGGQSIGVSALSSVLPMKDFQIKITIIYFSPTQKNSSNDCLLHQRCLGRLSFPSVLQRLVTNAELLLQRKLTSWNK